MTNDKTRKNDEIRMTKPATAPPRTFRHSGFGFLSSFVIRHSLFVIYRPSPSYFSRANAVQAHGQDDDNADDDFLDVVGPVHLVGAAVQDGHDEGANDGPRDAAASAV